MDYEKKYHLTQSPNTFILARWTRGFREIEFYYKNKLINRHEGTKNLKSGVKFNDPELGEIEFFLSKEPITLNILVDGYHCTNNILHPSIELKGVSNIFWVIAVFAIIGTLVEGFSIGVNLIGTIVTTINLLVVAVYIIAAVFTAKSQPWAFYMGFSVYCFFTLAVLLSLFNGNIMLIIGFFIRLAFLYFLITNLKHAVGTSKHNRFKSGNYLNDQLIDSNV